MATCFVCGNEYDKSFRISMNGEEHDFDCFECAIQALAPTCTRCGCRIIGHGAEAKGTLYCGAYCASEAGVSEMRDRL